MILSFIITILPSIMASADDSNHEARMKMYKDYEMASGVPWYQIAAVDQYERNIYKFREECNSLKYDTISICM